MEMNCKNVQLSKIEASYTKSCSQVFYRTAALKISKISQDPNLNAFVKMFQNFQNSYFYVTPLDSYRWIYRQMS